VAANKIVYIILKLLKDGAFEDNDTLLTFAYELMELVAEQGILQHLSMLLHTDRHRKRDRGIPQWNHLSSDRPCT
jgi:hypothetical protein